MELGTHTEEDGREYHDSVEVKDKHREQAAKMQEAYLDDRPTVVMPGSDNTVTGTAVHDWVDEDGNPKYGDGENADVAEKEDPAPTAEPLAGK